MSTGCDMSPVAVFVFAKAPVPGLAKTRLAPALGADGAARLAASMLEHTAGQAAAAGIGPVELCASPDSRHPLFAEIAARHGLALASQGEGDLGQRMYRAFARALAEPGGAVGVRLGGALLIGTDAPALDAAVLRRAAGALAQHEAVFVPALDGGYALVGLRQADPRWFEGMHWSTPTVMSETRKRLAAAGVGWAELGAVADVDEPADLIHVPRAWLPAAGPIEQVDDAIRVEE